MGGGTKISRHLDYEMDTMADVNAMMALAGQIQQQYQASLRNLRDQMENIDVEPPPDVKRRAPMNMKVRREQIRQKLERDLEEERRRRVTLADTVYSDFSLLDEKSPEVLKQGLLKKAER